MSAESVLSSVIEAAVGLGGFAGIIAAIRQRNVTHWPLGQRIFLQMLLTASAAAIVCSFLPWLLEEMGVPESLGWRICSGLLLLWLIGIGMRRGQQIRTSGWLRALPRLFYVWTTLNLTLQTVNLYLGLSWPYLVGVIGVLANGFTFFLVLLFWQAEEDEGPAPPPAGS